MLAGCLRLLLKNLDIRNIATRDVGIVVSINTFKASQIQVKKKCSDNQSHVKVPFGRALPLTVSDLSLAP
jgi:hypothetical protein